MLDKGDSKFMELCMEFIFASLYSQGSGAEIKHTAPNTD